MSKMGGKSVDWTLWIGAFSVSLEVKTRGSERRMTKGETAFFEECPGVKRVVVTKEDVIQAIEDYAPIAKIVQSMVASSDQNPL